MAKEQSATKAKRAQMKKDVQAQKKEYKKYLKESAKELKQKEKDLEKLEKQQYVRSKMDPLWYLLMVSLIIGVWVVIFYLLIHFGVLELPNGI